MLICRAAYNKTQGWCGFKEFGGAGEDCDIFRKIEEVAWIVFLDKELLSLPAPQEALEHGSRLAERARDVEKTG